MKLVYLVYIKFRQMPQVINQRLLHIVPLISEKTSDGELISKEQNEVRLVIVSSLILLLLHFKITVHF